MNDAGSIPESFLKAIRRAAEDLARSSWKELVQGADGQAMDVWMREHGGEFLRGVLAAAISARSERIPITETCECGEPIVFRQRRPFVFHTVIPGRDVEARICWGRCGSCGKWFAPIVADMKVDSEGFTQGLTDLAVLAAVIEPYEAAGRDLLGRFAGVRVSKEKMESLVSVEGKRADEFVGAAAPAANPPSAQSPSEPLYVAIDGGMIRVDKAWQEVKLACLFGGEERTEVSKDRATLSGRRFVAVRGNPEALGDRLWPMAEAAGAATRKVVVLGDGAPWIWNLAADRFPERAEILDWYHANEHLSEAARKLYGPYSEKAAAWRKSIADRLWENDIDGVIQDLEVLATRQRSQEKRSTLEELAGYFTKNRTRMTYGSYRDRGYHVGSGAVESAVNHVVQQRMKRPGMRWKSPGADAILALRCVYRTTGAWDRFCSDRPIRKAA